MIINGSWQQLAWQAIGHVRPPQRGGLLDEEAILHHTPLTEREEPNNQVGKLVDKCWQVF